MENKQQLIDSIKDWVKLDNEIRKLQSEITSRKNEKKNVSTKLMQTMNANNIDCFDIKDGQLCYNKRSVKKPITKKGLFDILTKYYNGDFTIFLLRRASAIDCCCERCCSVSAIIFSILRIQ